MGDKHLAPKYKSIGRKVAAGLPKKMTLHQAAKKMRCSHQTVSDIENVALGKVALKMRGVLR